MNAIDQYEQSRENENKARLTANEMQTFASHVATIMRTEVRETHTQQSPMKMGFAIGTRFHVEIKFWHRSTGMDGEGAVWDQTEVNGQWTGNRCGAVQEFTRLVFAAYEFKP